MTVRVLEGDCRARLAELEAGSIQTCVTSPPYWGLRSYGGGAAEIGAEESLDEYLDALVAVFAGVWRVLREDGTLWLNLGDCYAPDARWGGASGNKNSGAVNGNLSRSRRRSGLKFKDLVGLPWRVAFALQDEGWYLRSDIIWAKEACMPENVQDRPTRAHEYIFLLTKKPHYYYDALAVAEPAVSTHGSGNGFKRPASLSRDGRGNDDPWMPTATRNRRSWWVINPRPFPEAHYAVFPEAIPELAILAGTSPMACPTCAAPWKRRVTRYRTLDGQRTEDLPAMRSTSIAAPSSAQGMAHDRSGGVTEDRGWAAGCPCPDNDGSGRCVVLDPFCGSGTTLRMALKHGRDAVGIDLQPAYLDLVDKRTSGVQMSLESVV